jgi:hypothetical protein
MRTIIVFFFILTAFYSSASAKTGADTVYKQIVQVGAEASCFYYELRYASGEKVMVPAEVEQAMQCPVMLSLSHNYNYLLYAVNDSVRMYDFTSGASVHVTDFHDRIIGFSNALWSPDDSRFAFVQLENWNPHFSGGIYTAVVENGDVKNVIIYMEKIRFTCGSICTSYPGHDFWFIDNSHIGFRPFLNTPDEEGEITAEIDLNKKADEELMIGK